MTDQPVTSEEAAEKALLERWQEATGEDASNSSRSTAETIHSILFAAIVESDLPPGWRLGEERLARLFSVSRTPVREALAALASSNLARRDSRGTLRVSAITPEQILHVYKVRESLEGLAAGLAAESAAPRAINRLKMLNETFRQAGEASDFDALTVANDDFHTAIANSTENDLLIRFLADIRTWVTRFPRTTLTHPGRAETATKEHAAIIEAIEARDAALAERLAREHMQVAEQIRIEMLTSRGVAV